MLSLTISLSILYTQMFFQILYTVYIQPFSISLVTIGLEDVTITRDEGSSAEVCVTVIDVPLFFESGYNFNVSITTDEPGQSNMRFIMNC